MVDLNEFVGESALRKSIDTKKKKAEAKLAVLLFGKVNPLEREIEMYEKMLSAMDERESSDSEQYLTDSEKPIGHSAAKALFSVPAPTFDGVASDQANAIDPDTIPEPSKEFARL